MKKFLSLFLCLVLLASLSFTALAAVTTDTALNDRLQAITLSVKNTLGIGDSFTSFMGTVNETGTASLWSLYWSSNKEQLSVTANENGTIVSFNNYAGSIVMPPSSGRIPRFPKITMDEAKAAAKTFLDKVLHTSYETVDLQGTSNLDYAGSAVFYLSGVLKLYGVDSPVNISVSVSSDTKKVTSFYRSDYGQDYSGVTKPSAATDKAAAAAALKGTLNMKMTYALPGDGSHTARLQYLPNPAGNFIVDAATGQLVDLSKLDYSNSPYPVSKESTADSGLASTAGSGLTTVEQSAVDKMQGVLSRSDLENIVRAYSELGLTSDFKVQYVNYYTYEDENKVTHVVAALEFAFTPKDGTPENKYITMDAKLGKLISVGGGRIYIDTRTPGAVNKYTAQQTEATARAFAAKILPDEVKQTALGDTVNSTSDSVHTYIFYRAHEGINFPENYISVGVDAQTGFIVSFYSSWYTYEVTFMAPGGAITADAAAAKFSEGAGTVLRYVAVPPSTHKSGLLLAYTRADSNVWGVNALTGELLKSAPAADSALTYSDIDGNPYAAMIKQLASYGVGFPGGAFKPGAQLTQEDALVLITSTNGRKVIPLPLSLANTDDLYNTAYSMGILTPEEKDPAKLISRAEFTKYLVNALGYGEVARLSGIFKAGFTDDKSIPAPLAGYVAIAKGLGIIRGDQNGNFKPNDTATRLQAAIMLYYCMSRI